MEEYLFVHANASKSGNCTNMSQPGLPRYHSNVAVLQDLVNSNGRHLYEMIEWAAHSGQMRATWTERFYGTS